MDRGRWPDGAVTFVFTDIEGSTRLLRELGPRYADVLSQHRDILRGAWSDHDGQEVDSRGDAFFVAFHHRDDALAACAQAQRALAAASWPDDARVRVRMGVHTGLAAPRDGQYVAFAVHQAARVMAAAHGGQVVVSEQATPEAADPGLLVPLGLFRVRDFDRPVQLYQLAGPGLPADFPVVRAMPATHHNLSPPPTGLIGRDTDLQRLADSLDVAQLVTVVGTGGVGKTRLVTELGVRMTSRWPDGVWLADCSPLEDPALLPQAVAAALGISARSGQPVDDELRERLRGCRLLILLDACERHRGTARDLAAGLTRDHPGVQVLATSTEPLHAPGEIIHRLGPLPAADIRSPAVVLFAERARAADASFAWDDETAAIVLSLCRRLDGLPLAVEIAAARTTVLQPREILAGLDDRFQLLRGGGDHRPVRQHTLSALLDWSFRLLTAQEALVMRRLALFAASFDVDAATVAVGTPLDPGAVTEAVWSLVDKSLLFTDLAGGRTRYRALETVRSYAREQLDAADETAGCAERLAGFYRERLGPARGTGRAWVHAVGTELDNLRAVIRLISARDPATASELAATIGRHHNTVQSFSVGISETTSHARTLVTPSPARVGLLTVLGDLHARIGDTAAAERCAIAAAQLRTRTGAPPWDEVGVERLLGDVAIRNHHPEQTIELAQAALQQDLSPRGRARMFNMLGIALATTGRDDEAAAAFTGELEAATAEQDDVLLTHAYSNAAEIALRQNQIQEAARQQEAALDLAVAVGQTGTITLALLGAAQIGVAATADWAGALRLVAKAETLERLTQMDLYDTDRDSLTSFLARARAVLGPQDFQRHQQAGRELSADDALALARQSLRTAGAATDAPWPLTDAPSPATDH